MGSGQKHRRWVVGARQHLSRGVAEFQCVALVADERVSLSPPARRHGLHITDGGTSGNDSAAAPLG